MKREIKFRAWDKLDEKLRTIKSIQFLGGECQLFYKNKNGLAFYPQRLLHQIELMQYTGLLDKNGKEIYEGDIMKVTDPMEEEDNQCVVEWHDNNSCYQYESEQGFGDFDVTSIGWAMQMEFEFEIIGNIYENENLLNGK